VPSTGHALPKDFGDGSLAIFRPDKPVILGNESPREFVVAICAPIGQAFVESGRETLASTALRLCQALLCVPQFVRVRNLLASRESQEGMKAGINPYGPVSHRRNAWRPSIDEQAKIPPRGPLDEPSTFDPALGKVLSMKPEMSYPWHVDARAGWRFEGIRKRHTRQLVALPFQAWLLRQFLVAALPRGIRRVQHALQRMTRNPELLAMIGRQIMEGFLAVIDAVFGIGFTLADSPIPDACQMPEPVLHGLFLRAVESELELSLNHIRRASDFRYIA